MARTCEDSLDTPVNLTRAKTMPSNKEIQLNSFKSSTDSPEVAEIKSRVYVIDSDSSTDEDGDSFASAASNNGGNVSEEFDESPVKTPSKKKEDSISLTPPPSTSPVKKVSVVVKELAKCSVSPLALSDDEDQFQFKPSGPSNKAIINLVDSDDEVQVVSDPVKVPSVPKMIATPTYTMRDVQELEGTIKKKQSIIAQNSYLLAQQHGRLPDGGRSLRETIAADKASLTKLREVLVKARASVQSTKPVAQGMFMKTSNSNIPPINNQPPNVQLSSLKKKKADLTKSLQPAVFQAFGGWWGEDQTQAG